VKVRNIFKFYFFIIKREKRCIGQKKFVMEVL